MVGRIGPDPGSLAARRPPDVGQDRLLRLALAAHQCTRTAGDVNGQLVAPFPGWPAAIGQEIIARRNGRSRLAGAARGALAAT